MYTVEDDYGTIGTPPLTKTSTVYYGSTFHNQPTRTVASTSTGDSLITTTQYAFDFRLASCDAITDGTTTYSTNCSNCQTAYNTAQTACSGSGPCLSTAYLNFLACQYKARVSYDSTRRLNYVNPTNAWGSCHLTAETSADTLLKPILRLQDEYVDAPIEMTQWKDASLKHASFTRYDTSTSPIGFCYPGRTKLVNLQALSGTFTNAAVSGNTIAKDSRYADETFYTFANGNPIKVLPRNGVTQSYIWDYLNTQPVAKVSNAAQTDIAYTSFETSGTGGIYLDNGETGIVSTDAVTGTNSYQINNGLAVFNLNPAKTYIVSLWAKSGTPSYNGYNGSTLVVATNNVWTTGKTINGWTYLEISMTGVATINVGGGGGAGVDEVRFYPANAQMTSPYLLSPLVGTYDQPVRCRQPGHLLFL